MKYSNAHLFICPMEHIDGPSNFEVFRRSTLEEMLQNSKNSVDIKKLYKILVHCNDNSPYKRIIRELKAPSGMDYF